MKKRLELKDYEKIFEIERNSEEKLEQVKNYFSNIMHHSNIFDNVDKDEECNILYRYCNSAGIEYHDYIHPISYIINQVCSHNISFKETVIRLKLLLSAIDNKEIENDVEEVFVDALDRFDYKYELLKINDEIIYIPVGDKIMDAKLVVEVVNWLDNFPDSKKAWLKSIEKFTDHKFEDASMIADLFRKSLETFFKEFFKNNKSLENNKSEFGKYLKERSIPKEISNNLEKLLELYNKFNNEYSKHNDKTSEHLLEFIMYQTGNIMRLLFNISNSNI